MKIIISLLVMTKENIWKLANKNIKKIKLGFQSVMPIVECTECFIKHYVVKQFLLNDLKTTCQLFLLSTEFCRDFRCFYSYKVMRQN